MRLALDGTEGSWATVGKTAGPPIPYSTGSIGRYLGKATVGAGAQRRYWSFSRVVKVLEILSSGVPLEDIVSESEEEAGPPQK